MPAQQEPVWFKSSYSGGSGTECVEIAAVPGSVLVRDSKVYDGPRLALPLQAWTEFLRGVRRSD
ncbi:DUF397 domain-containing protein [Streptomyces sp. NPDC050085]|uniref:DUF397 domain-containing protein n=1 Tax=Streptomyces sp. NPDC050085 TaxID=3365600 RepID=UPI0037A33799